jgi:hypothetical protein
MIIYLDESGDLGWKLTEPYRYGGSSRYLTIACLVVSNEQKNHPKRLIKKLYKKFNWPVKIEKKWSDMNLDERIWFAEKANELCTKFPQNIKYMSITVQKTQVKQHIKKDANTLYNYMIKLLLIDEMSKYENIILMPDSRSIKVKSGNSLHDYLQTELWFERKVSTILSTIPCDSATSQSIQFADMLSGIVQGYFEDDKIEPWNKIKNTLSHQTLYF